MAPLLWLTVAAPLLAAAGVRVAPRHSGALAVAGAVIAAVPAWILLTAAAAGEVESSGFAWIPAAPGLDAGLRLDPLSAAMSAIVATVGLVVLLYSAGYFARSPRRRQALAGLLAFLAAMQGLVLADGYLTLLIFWELVGALSARLIAWNRDDPSAPAGAVRAFLTTRGADLGLYLALFALYAAAGSLAFGAGRPGGALGALIGLGLVLAAMGKSAQFPLQSWLAGAMAGPTPVSALLHSATMVAAGVYLLLRSQDLLAGWPLEVAGWVGAVTAVLGAGIALTQTDLKRVLAGSTSSQLGLMFVAAALARPALALFYLVAQAASKAGMFLTAGIFQHNRGTTDLAGLAGAGREDRRTFAIFAVCAASIAAVPPFALFWTKDELLVAALERPAWFALALLAAAGSAAYVLRPALILWRRSAVEGRMAAIDAPGRRPMLLAAAVMAFGALGAGALGAPLGRLLVEPGDVVSLAVTAAALAAIAAGVVAISLKLTAPAWLRSLGRAQLYVNEVLRTVFERPLIWSAGVANAFDRRGIDAAVDGTGRATLGLARFQNRIENAGIDAAVDGLARAVGRGGDRTSSVQSGHLHEYLRDTILGALAIIVVIAISALT
ncbi:MAG: NADH-quinone oxidoreductase subunit L [Solirubrobacterales bacterium]